MTEDTFKNDLFGEGSGLRKQKRSFLRRYAHKPILPYVKFALEHVVIAVIVMLVLLVVVYAVGVEVGSRKGISSSVEPVEKAPFHQKDEIEKEDPLEHVFPVVHPSVSEKRSGAHDKEEATDKAAADTTVKPKTGEYVVQLASFRSHAVAESEAQRLREEGHHVQVEKHGNWHQVNAVGYESYNEAAEARSFFKGTYDSCFVRRADN